MPAAADADDGHGASYVPAGKDGAWGLDEVLCDHITTQL